MYNMLCSLHFLHSANLMHRDIKPANILITDNCTIKICDFGLSRDMIKANAIQREKEGVRRDKVVVGYG